MTMERSPIAALSTPRRVFPAGRFALAGLLSIGAGLVAQEQPSVPVQVQARALLAEARTAAKEGRIVEAQGLIDRAARIAPGDPEVIKAAETLEGRAADPGPVKDEALKLWAAREIESARARAETAIRAGRYEDAAETLVVVERALIRHRLDADPGLAERLVALRAEITGLRQRQRQVDDAVSGKDRSAALAAARQRVADQEDGRDRRFRERMARIRELRLRGHLEPALADARRLVADEPDRDEARSLYATLLDEAHESRGLTTEERRTEISRELAERTRASLLPGRDDILPTYPKDWAKRHQGGHGILQQEEEPVWRTDLRGRLAARVNLTVEAMPLTDVVRLIAQQAGVNIVVDPQVATTDHPVTLAVPGMRADNALSWVCRQAGTTWGLDREAVVVGPIAKVPPQLAVFDVAALVHVPQDRPGPKWFVVTQEDANITAAEAPKAPTVEDLVDLIHKAVSPETWEDGISGITARGSVLYVTAPPEVHRLIRELIRSQEASQSLMVRVDARWIDVNDGYFEQVGVTWTTTRSQVNLPNVTSGAKREWTQGDAQATVTAPLPATRTTYGSQYQPSFNLSIAHVGPIQLSAVVQAGEHAGQVRTLLAPSLTTLNAVRSHFYIGHQTAYLGGYEMGSGGGGAGIGAMSPRTKVVTTGVGLDVKPIVSSDRKYVTLDLLPVVRDLRLFSESITSVGGITANQVGGITTASSFPIELPNIHIRAAATTVTIPDRGSLLVGGFGKTVDERLSTGVPYLSDIPYLGRLFGTRARGSERSQLYLLTTATILSYDELETSL